MDMHYLARSMGVSTPDTFFPRSRQDAVEFAASARFPIILKTIQDRKAAGETARTKAIVRTKWELLASYDRMEGPDSPNLLLQEYIPGGEDANWMFNGYFDAGSDCLFGLTGQKIRQWRFYRGCTSLGVCWRNDRVEEIVKRFMKGIGYRGILDIGLRYDARDGDYKVFDVNPRIGCTFRLFVSDNGMDVARAMYLDLTGQPVEAGGPIPERRWMVEDTDLAAAFCYWRDRNLSFRQWLKSFRGVRESAFFASDDPRPVLKMCANDLAEIFSWLRRPQNGNSSCAHTPLEPPVAKN
jgi:predicted ATP-grasp superfamily ATP-dependent carboligase